jgi:hypothetical protein
MKVRQRGGEKGIGKEDKEKEEEEKENETEKR